MTKDEMKDKGITEQMDNYLKYIPQCSTLFSDEFLDSKFIEDIKSQFDKNCKGQIQCDIDFDISLLNS